MNRVHADLAGLFPGYHHQIPNLIYKGYLDAAHQLLADDQRVRAELARRRLARVLDIDRETAELKHRIAGYVAASGTSLTSIYGIGHPPTLPTGRGGAAQGLRSLGIPVGGYLRD